MSQPEGGAAGGEEHLAGEDPHSHSSAVAALSAPELAKAFGEGELTSVEVAEQLIGRIEALDASGIGLRSVLEVAPDALEEAARLDAERQQGRLRGPLHGVPVLLKDNIDTVAPLHTTAGSTAFGESTPQRDAPLVSALRQAGALLLGKANLSEFAKFRSRPSASGWSAVGGQTRNPHALDRTPGGSSAGSAAAVAARLAPLSVGTETDGSILCPAAACGVAGLKPTVGLVSRSGIVPISSSQDTAGPMARSVEELALLLEVLARASHDGDEAARPGRRPKGLKTNYVSLLGDGGLSGVRVGVLRQGGYFDYHPPTDRVFEGVLAALSESGAQVVDPLEGPGDRMVSGEDEMAVLTYEFCRGIEGYLARRAAADPEASGLPRTIEDLLSHLESDPAERCDLFGVELIAQSAATKGDDGTRYRAAHEANLRRARSDGLDRLFGGERPVDVVAVPAMSPPWLIDHVLGDSPHGSGWSPAAVAGYPSATLPMGMVGGLPVGVALWGAPWSEATLLRVMFALERCFGPSVTRPVPAFAGSVSLRG